MNYLGTTLRAQLIRILKFKLIDILKAHWPINKRNKRPPRDLEPTQTLHQVVEMRMDQI